MREYSVQQKIWILGLQKPIEIGITSPSSPFPVTYNIKENT